MSFNTDQIMPPQDWQRFEKICLDLYREIWKDPAAKLNGRGGQPQAGTDVYGQPSDSGGKWFGIQCKGKDANFGGEVTEKELRIEIEKAKKFVPALSDWTLATTAKKDTEIEEIARIISDEHAAQGLFAVHIMAWGDLQPLIGNSELVMEKWWTDQAPKTRQLLQNTTENLTVSLNTNEMVSSMRDELQRMVQQLSSASITPTDPGAGTNIDPKDIRVQARLDAARDLIKSGSARAALKMLTQMESEEWDQASPRVRFRLLTNLGAAHYKLGHAEEAAGVFMRAMEWGEDEPLAYANQALAFMIRRDDVRAGAAAQEALRRDPANTGAASLRILASMEEDGITDPLTLVPEGLLDSAEVIVTAGRWYREKGNAAKALEMFERAHDLDPSAPPIMFDLAASLADGILKNREAVHGRRLSPDAWKTLDRANGLFAVGWDAVRGMDEAKVFVGNASNLVVILRFYEKTDEAETRLHQGLAVAPDDPALLLQKALILASRGQNTEAQKILKNLPGTDVEVPFLLADSLAASGKTDEALSVNQKLLELPTEKDQKLARFQRVNILIRADRADVALKSAEELTTRFPNCAAGFAMLSDAHFKLGNEQQALEPLARAKELLATVESEPFDKIFTAESLCGVKDWDSVAGILAPMTASDHDSHLLRQRVGALINADRRREATDLLGSLTPEVMDIPFFRRAAATIYERSGELEAALHQTELSLAKHPADIEMRLLWVQILEQLNRTEEADTYFRGDINIADDTPVFPRMALAQVLNKYGYPEKAFALGYETLRRNWSNPTAHNAYQGLVFMQAGADKVIPISTEEIGINTGFTLEGEGGKPGPSYIIEPDAPRDPQLGEIAPDSALAKRAIGLHVGDGLKIQDYVGADSHRIHEIKHKYLHMLHRSMEEFNQLFPNEQGLLKFAIDEHDPELALAKMLELLQHNRDGTRELLASYKSTLIPIAVIAKLAGKSLIEFWYNLMASGTGIDVCLGTKEERDHAIKLLSKKPRLVVDPLTFWVAGINDALDGLHETFGPLGLTPSAIDTLTRYLDQVEHFVSHGGQSIGTNEAGDRLVLDQPSEEHKARSLELARKIVDWATSKCEILPAIPKTDFNSGMRELAKHMDPAILDTLAAANGSGRVLLCDDRRVRMVAMDSSRQEGVWLQVAMLVAMNARKLDRATYYEATVNLAAAGHLHTTLDAEAFFRAAEKAKWSPDGMFRKICQVLGGPTIDPRSMKVVACTFLKLLWSAAIATNKKIAMSQVFLDEVLKDKSAQSGEIIKTIAQYAPPSTKDAKGKRSWKRGIFVEFLDGYTKKLTFDK
jgi:tetratricopeptide (TPR) repeat protein